VLVDSLQTYSLAGAASALMQEVSTETIPSTQSVICTQREEGESFYILIERLSVDDAVARRRPIAVLFERLELSAEFVVNAPFVAMP